MSIIYPSFADPLHLHSFPTRRSSDLLSEHSGLPAMVCLHHHPVDIGSDWMNQIGLKNREAFWQVIDKHPQVKVVRSEEHTSELQSRPQIVCRLLLEKKNHPTTAWTNY